MQAGAGILINSRQLSFLFDRCGYLGPIRINYQDDCFSDNDLLDDATPSHLAMSSLLLKSLSSCESAVKVPIVNVVFELNIRLKLASRNALKGYGNKNQAHYFTMICVKVFRKPDNMSKAVK